jgi:hypothetical protein
MADIEGQDVNPGGVSRREIIKRGAIVGGTALWAAPVIQSLASPAMAQGHDPESRCGCCYCWNGNILTTRDDECSDDGAVFERSNPSACAAFCTARGFANSQQCATGPGGCSCSQNNNPPGANGCTCV